MKSRRSTATCARFWSTLAAVALTLLPCAGSRAQQPPAPDALEQYLARRLAERPDDASTWRMLGRMRMDRQDVPGALDAHQRAVAWDPNSAGAHFDLARACLAAGQWERACFHLDQTVALAPGSDYAHSAADLARDVRRRSLAVDTSPLGSDLDARRFAGVPLRRQPADETRLLTVSLDLGLLYNSNVQLAPVSRQTLGTASGTFQAYTAPDIQYLLLNTDRWRGGATFQGYFTWNEGNDREFDLQDYQPGAFVERRLEVAAGELRARLQYDYTYDLFGGSFFGQRHAVNSLLTLARPLDEWAVYWTVDASDFAQDGVDPEITSLDGWTHTLGASRTWFPEAGWFQLIGAGLDAQWAPLRGQDFAYRGLFGYGEAELPLLWQWELALRLGLGYRNYPDFTGDVPRDELLWHGSSELRRDLSDHWRIAGFYVFDRFASDNADFDSQRYLAGIRLTYLR